MSISFVSSNMDVFIELFIMLHKFNVYLNPGTGLGFLKTAQIIYLLLSLLICNDYVYMDRIEITYHSYECPIYCIRTCFFYID